MTCLLNLGHFYLDYSVHAVKRAHQRGIREDIVAHILRFGRKQFQNGALYYSIGRKEIKKYVHLCPALKQMNGLHLVMALNGTIITLFRNQHFKHIRHC